MKITIDCVDIDKAIIEIASKWFNFKTDDKLHVYEDDGLKFINRYASNSEGQHCFLSITRQTVINSLKFLLVLIILSIQHILIFHQHSLLLDGNMYDVIIFDVNSGDNTTGMSCPPKQFITGDVLRQVSTIMSDKGIIALLLIQLD